MSGFGVGLRATEQRGALQRMYGARRSRFSESSTPDTTFGDCNAKHDSAGLRVVCTSV